MNKVSTCLYMVIAVNLPLLLIGCSKGSQTQPADTEIMQYYSGKIKELADWDRGIDDHQEKAIWEFVESEINAGKSERLAIYFMMVPDDSQPLRFYVAEGAFAGVMCSKVSSEKADISKFPKTVSALKKIADKGGFRRSRIRAGIAIIKIEPEAVKKAFLGTYALGINVIVDWSAEADRDKGVAPYLEEMDVMVPEEIIATTGVQRLMDYNSPDRTDMEFCKRAGNAYNEELSKLLTAGKWEELKKLHDNRTAREQLMDKCRKWVKANPEKPTGSLFAGPSTEPSIFDKLVVPKNIPSSTSKPSE